MESRSDPENRFVFRLFIAGRTHRSQVALETMRAVCEEHLRGCCCEVEIVDVLESPHLAESERILATPALVQVWPLPQRQIIGDLSDRQRVLSRLNLPATGPKTPSR